MAGSSALDDAFRRAFASPRMSSGGVAVGLRRWEADLEARAARAARGVLSLARAGVPALAFIYLALIWAVFAGVLQAIPQPGRGSGALVLAGLAGL